MKAGVSREDENERRASNRFLYINGPPGSGKSAVLLHLAIWASEFMEVLIICPTGLLVHQYKSRLPEQDGVERIRVDTVQGVLNYKRKGQDSKVTWSPPSALRRIDLILVDEGSQYADLEFGRLFQGLREQPHSPFVAIVADFQQLQPVVAEGDTSRELCKGFCQGLPTVELKTVYRTSDEDHLVFLNGIRHQQPDRPMLEQYFGDRHWKSSHHELSDCVRMGMDKAEAAGQPFVWLTSTNRGSSEVSQAALEHKGVTLDDLKKGYPCDPTSKSLLNILAIVGLIIRLTRNLDKRRGFVNGATAVIVEPLDDSNSVVIAKLIGTGNLVLVHPIHEHGETFLPCCYGYATTIRQISCLSGMRWFPGEGGIQGIRGSVQGCCAWRVLETNEKPHQASSGCRPSSWLYLHGSVEARCHPWICLRGIFSFQDQVWVLSVWKAAR